MLTDHAAQSSIALLLVHGIDLPCYPPTHLFLFFILVTASYHDTRYGVAVIPTPNIHLCIKMHQRITLRIHSDVSSYTVALATYTT